MIKKFVFALLLLSVTGQLFGQSPWTRSKDDWYAQLSVNVIPEYDQFYANDRTQIKAPRSLEDITVQGYVEYGVAESTILLFIVPYKVMRSGDEVEGSDFLGTTKSGSFSAFGNLEIGVRQQLQGGKFPLALQANVEIKSGEYDRDTGLRSGYDAWGFQQLVSAGWGTDGQYAFIYTGFVLRSNEFSTFLRIGAEYGYRITPEYWLAAFIDIVNSLHDGHYRPPVNNRQTAFYVNDQEYVAWGIKSFGYIIEEKTGFVLAVGGALAAANVAASPSINFGLFFEL